MSKLIAIVLLSLSSVYADVSSDWQAGCQFGLRSFFTRNNIATKKKGDEFTAQIKGICENRYNLVKNQLSSDEKKNAVLNGCGFAVGAAYRDTYGVEATAKLSANAVELMKLVSEHCLDK